MACVSATSIASQRSHPEVGLRSGWVETTTPPRAAEATGSAQPMLGADQADLARLRPHRAFVVGQGVVHLAADLELVVGIVLDHHAVEVDIVLARRLDEAVVL